MTVRIGVAGAGRMGSAHVAMLVGAVADARVTAVADVSADAARAAASIAGARTLTDGLALVADPEVDAVVIASLAETHEEIAVAALAAGKPVLCEKPLAPSVAGARRVLDAAAAHPAILLGVGFNRRFDPAYLELKGIVDRGEIGAPLVVHCAHRNPDVPDAFDAAFAITDSLVHEADTLPWLLGEPIARLRLVRGRPSRHAPNGVTDPMLAIYETASGVLVDVESFVRCRYGYDIRCEVVGEDGTATLPGLARVTRHRAGAASTAVPIPFADRFAEAYRAELQAFVHAASGVAPWTGATAMDGYAAAVVTQATLDALASGDVVDLAAAR
jgi:myo-inositol 2-dehydrogenase/D-chiro-inositol 1-dehydrogenase